MRGHIVVTLHPNFKDYMSSEDKYNKVVFTSSDGSEGNKQNLFAYFRRSSEDKYNKIVDIHEFSYESHFGIFSNDYTINISINNIVIISSKYSLKKYDFFIFRSDIYKKILDCDNLLVNKQQSLVDVADKGIYSIFKSNSQEIINFKHIYKLSHRNFASVVKSSLPVTTNPIIMICLILRIIESIEMNFHR
jgi:hypothetical protein